MANSQHILHPVAAIPPLPVSGAVGRGEGELLVIGGGEGEPVASAVPLLHPLLIPSPEAHWRSDVTPKRKLSSVPVSPFWMTLVSWLMVSFRRRRPVASVTLNSPMSTRSTTNNCRTIRIIICIHWHTGYYGDDDDDGGEYTRQ